MKKSTIFLFSFFVLGICQGQHLELIKSFDVIPPKSLNLDLDNYVVAEPNPVYEEVRELETFILNLDNLGFKELSGDLKFRRVKIFEGQTSSKRLQIINSQLFQSNENDYQSCLTVFENFICLSLKKGNDAFYVLTDAFLVTEKNMTGLLVAFKSPQNSHSTFKACGVLDEEFEAQQTKALRQVNSYDFCRKTKIACDIDNEWYNHWGSSLSFIYVAAIMNEVNSYFYNQLNMTVTNSYVHEWSTTDPYSSTTDGQTLAGEFRNYWNSNFTGISRDAAILFTYRSLLDDMSNPIDGQTYSASTSHLCDLNSAYAIIGENGASFTYYYYWITGHEVGHLAGASHETSSSNIMWTGSSIPNSTFLSSTQDEIWNYLYNGPDTECLITADIQMKRNGSGIVPYNPNYVCTFSSSALSAPGNHSISWTLNSNTSGAYYSSTGATSSTVYHGGSTGGFTVKASKTNDCGTIDRYYPFVVNNCFAYSYYPNQTSSFLNIEFEDIEYKFLPDDIYIVDEKGNRLLSASPKDYFNDRKDEIIKDVVKFDLSELNDGIYYLKVYYSSREINQTDTHRILKI